jgi:hypothetical protein
MALQATRKKPRALGTPGVTAWRLGSWAVKQVNTQKSKPPERKIIMKFMITWQFHQGKLHEGYSQFFKMTPEQDAADRGSRIKQIGRWHDLARGRDVVICESDSAEALANWALNWNGLLDAEVVPVLDDNETRALGKNREKSS